ncbi:hypothetical protein [Collinsella vaginalis]|uniref:hypothetical protein n=1 Tax=Collinsella vaginalis TaxID=1870987 RepID=UPI000A26BBAD|nr:hypothetical protein [Collinsella vaginalis]
MDGRTAVERDIDEMARWWQLRKFQYIDIVGREFVDIVRPMPAFKENPSTSEIMSMNIALTEWFLFERLYDDAGTPLESYIARPHRSVSEESLDRLRQVAATQFFSRFSIRDKDQSTGMAALEDTVSGRRYDVHDPHLCAVERWRDGVIAERIACVEGLWQIVGKARLYDRSPAAQTEPDGPGAVRPEDANLAALWEAAGPFLRLLRDCMGDDGRYRHSLTYRRV